jgi:hypothetical protein
VVDGVLLGITVGVGVGEPIGGVTGAVTGAVTGDVTGASSARASVVFWWNSNATMVLKASVLIVIKILLFCIRYAL